MTTLIEKAKAVQVKTRGIRSDSWTDEHLDLVLAYLYGEVTNKQMVIALGAPITGAASFVGSILAWGIRNKKIGKIHAN